MLALDHPQDCLTVIDHWLRHQLPHLAPLPLPAGADQPVSPHLQAIRLSARAAAALLHSVRHQQERHQFWSAPAPPPPPIDRHLLTRLEHEVAVLAAAVGAVVPAVPGVGTGDVLAPAGATPATQVAALEAVLTQLSLRGQQCWQRYQALAAQLRTDDRPLLAWLAGRTRTLLPPPWLLDLITAVEADLGELEDVHATLLEAGRTFANLPPVRGRAAHHRRAAVRQRLQEIEAAWLETYEPLDRLRRAIALAQLGVAVLESTHAAPAALTLPASASGEA